MRVLKKVDMKRGQTDRKINKLTLRPYERIGLRADSERKKIKSKKKNFITFCFVIFVISSFR